jgi:hypothetical protein
MVEYGYYIGGPKGGGTLYFKIEPFYFGEPPMTTWIRSFIK